MKKTTTKTTKKETAPAAPVAVKFTLLAKHIDQMVKRVLPCASKEETRYYLNGIFFEYVAKEKVLNLVATDGHRLSRMTVKEFDTDAKENFHFIAPTESIKLMKGAYKNLKATSYSGLAEWFKVEFELAADRKTFTIECRDQSAKLKTIDGNYPSYRAVIPKELQKVVGFNANYMAELCKASVGDQKGAVGIELHFVPDKDGQRLCSPFMIKGNSNDTNVAHELILMSMRTGDDKEKMPVYKPKPLFYIKGKNGKVRPVLERDLPVYPVDGDVIQAGES